MQCEAAHTQAIQLSKARKPLLTFVNPPGTFPEKKTITPRLVCSSSRPTLQLGAHGRVAHLRVAHRRSDVAVAQPVLHGLKLVALLQQLGRRGVAELVDGVARSAGFIEQARSRTQLPPVIAHRAVAQPGGAVGAEQGVGVGHIAQGLQVPAEQAHAALGAVRPKDDHALHAVLRVAHMQPLVAGCEVDIAGVECYHLAHAHAGLAQQREDQPAG